MTNEKMPRVFAAIDPPQEVLRAIEGIQFRLRKLIHGVIHWTRPEGIHLTLKFFGNVEMGRLEEMGKRLAHYARETTTLQLQAERIGVFPDLDRPRVIWIGISGDIHPLEILQRKIEEGFTELGFEKESRPFRPHLTLGRVKTPRGLLGLAEVTENDPLYDAGQFTAGSLNLIKSDLTPTGAIYTRLACFPLQGT
ncbi:MAG: RNA 2',3'-cyclic phosphodiesterase [Smithellaceae bacterium]|nr:RNA 2',3'-cyclic phosphodiesterase [Smithellaceae bacterium]